MVEVAEALVVDVTVEEPMEVLVASEALAEDHHLAEVLVEVALAAASEAVVSEVEVPQEVGKLHSKLINH